MKNSVQKGSFLSFRTIIRPTFMFEWRDREPDPRVPPGPTPGIPQPDPRDISARPPGFPGLTPGIPQPDPRDISARPSRFQGPTPGIPRPDPPVTLARPPGSPGPTPRDLRLYPPPSAGPRLAFPRYLYKRASQLTANSPHRRPAAAKMEYTSQAGSTMLALVWLFGS